MLAKDVNVIAQKALNLSCLGKLFLDFILQNAEGEKKCL